MRNVSTRYELFDTIRGLTLISMVFYHGAWDLVYLFSEKINWYIGNAGDIWQQSICISFIILSGFSQSFSRRKYKNGIKVTLAGILITVLSFSLFYHQRILFGILTLLGACMLFTDLTKEILRKVSPSVGLFVNFILFLLFRRINEGILGLFGWKILKLPKAWYHGYIMTFFGFTDKHFFSTDYFSFLPWIFLFLMGFYLYPLWEKMQKNNKLLHFKIPGITFMGQHTLVLYLLHQPLVYGGLLIFYNLK